MKHELSRMLEVETARGEWETGDVRLYSWACGVCGGFDAHPLRRAHAGKLNHKNSQGHRMTSDCRAREEG